MKSCLHILIDSDLRRASGKVPKVGGVGRHYHKSSPVRIMNPDGKLTGIVPVRNRKADSYYDRFFLSNSKV